MNKHYTTKEGGMKKEEALKVIQKGANDFDKQGK